jgi:hypothetical protein
MEIKPKHKHRLRTNQKNRSRTDYKGKNKSEWKPRKSGGHRKKTKHVMVAGASDIDLSSSTLRQAQASKKKRWTGTRASGRARTSMAMLCCLRLLRHGTQLRE